MIDVLDFTMRGLKRNEELMIDNPRSPMGKSLNFGCGRNILDGFDNVDIQKAKGILKSFDFEIFPYPLESDTYDFILAGDVFEHLDRDKLDKVIDEIYRISKDGGIIEVRVPYCRSLGAYSDVEHQNFFNEVSLLNLFMPLSHDHYKDDRFEILSLELDPSLLGKIIPTLRLKMIANWILNDVFYGLIIRVKVRK